MSKIEAGIVHVPSDPPPHACAPPEIWTFGPIKDGVPTIEHYYRGGTVWQCSCGVAQIVCWKPAERVGNMHFAGGWVWRRETRHQRRKRLGLRWWQREAR